MEVLDVRAAAQGSWWHVGVAGMPGLMAQVSSLAPRQHEAPPAASSTDLGVADVSVRRVVQVSGAAATSTSTRQRRDGELSWTQQAVRATRLTPRRVAALLAD